MKNRILLSLCSLLVAIAIIFPANAAAKELVLKLAEWGPDGHFVPKARTEWVEAINKAGEGRVKIVRYPGGQLYGPKDMHTAVAKGSVDMGVILTPAMLSTFPVMQGVYLPFAFEDLDHTAEAYSGESLEIIEKAMEKKRLKLIYVSYLDGAQMFSNKGNIEKVEDFNGLRVLSTSPMFSEILAKLGAAPDTSIPQTEQYMALKRKVSDAMANTSVGGYFQKSHEVAPYLTKMDLSFPTTLICVNTRVWKKIPKDIQKLMLEVGKEKSAQTLAAAKAWEQKFTDEMAKEGATVTRIPDAERKKIQEIARPVWEKWAEENGKDAKKLLEINTAE